jgi:16S rRNA (guanine527-N7)-methyltransferase
VKPHELWSAILEEADIEATSAQLEQLSAYQDWLATEAVAGGGVSPGETERLSDRHIGDSLLFTQVIGKAGPIIDVGSGVGLPGIPLAVVLPQTEILCLDRSGRRVDLASRAIRILDLKNVTAEQGSVEHLSARFPTVVSRAAIPPDRFHPILLDILEPGGSAVLGGSWKTRPSHPGYETREIGEKILNTKVWILMMSTT